MDKPKIMKANDIVAKQSYSQGIMAIGKYKGLSVKEAREKTKADMVESNDFMIYYEPDKLVISRTNDECIVGTTNAWFLKYGEESWKEEIDSYFNSEDFETYSPTTKSAI